MYRRDTSKSYLSTPTAWLELLPRILKLTEYRPSWVSIPASMAGMPMDVWKIPVTSPARAPASTAHIREMPREWPARIIIIHTAPPVAMVPSTVKSARSSIL